MSSNFIKNVAIIGATGRMGGYIASALVSTGKHNVTAVTRTNSKGEVPAGVKVVRADYTDEPALISAFTGQQMLIITLGVRAPPDTHQKLVNAASKAGVAWVMPNTWGGDLTNEKLLNDMLYGAGVKDIMRQVKEAPMDYITVCCGFWYEWSLAIGPQWYGFDIKNKTVVFYDDGKTKINTSTWLQAARAVEKLLSLPEHKDGQTKGYTVDDWKGKQVYVSSWRMSQRDMLDSLHRVLGDTDADWKISHETSEQRYKDGLAEFKAGDFKGFAKSMYARNFYPNGDADYESSKGLDNDKFGLPKEDLDEATKRAVDMVNDGWDPLATM